MDRVRDAAVEEGVRPTAPMRRRIEEGFTRRGPASGQDTGHMGRLSELVHRAVREELEEAGLR